MSKSDDAIWRRSEVGLWTDDKVTQLSWPPANGLTLWQYMLSGPQTRIIPGLYVFSVGDTAEFFHWSIESTRGCLEEILTFPTMARFDPRTRLLWLPNSLQKNFPANPNVVKSWRRAWSALPRCPLLGEAIDHMSIVLTAGKGMLTAFRMVTGDLTWRKSPNGITGSSNGSSNTPSNTPSKQDSGSRREDPRTPSLGAGTSRARVANAEPTPLCVVARPGLQKTGTSGGIS